jgi:Polynucleotide kinase 3 phosphatase
LGFELQAFIATAEDEYRKPQTTMWDVMVREYNGGIKPSMKQKKVLSEITVNFCTQT